ncbi:MAG: prolyl aminopeptidase [Parvularculaceae bacterium]|nr:prolyl aminopeptidase [Parvularculaceae bacterium]
MRPSLYPPVEPFQRGRLQVSPIHDIYFEVSGNPKGKPVVVCHGGPGGGSTPSMRRFFNPSRYQIVLFDQRGCGRSTPHAELRENTTWDLVADMEALRGKLGIEKWQIFGGSWGSTLALTYALTHPERVTELVLRGIFTLRHEELLWFYQEGASWVYPEAWEKFVEIIPENERDDMMGAYRKRLIGDDDAAKIEAAKAWSVWEGSTVSLLPDPARMESFSADRFALAFARIENHYFTEEGFFEKNGWIIDQAPKLAGLPGTIVQGRYDVVTPMKSAWELHQRWPGSQLKVVTDAGHAASEPGIIAELIKATDRYAS